MMKQKQMLAKYITLYDMHKSLPRITDAHYIVANFCADSSFDELLRDLMKVLYRVDQLQFYDVICQAAFQLLQAYKSESSVKVTFHQKTLIEISAHENDLRYRISSKKLKYSRWPSWLPMTESSITTL